MCHSGVTRPRLHPPHYPRSWSTTYTLTLETYSEGEDEEEEDVKEDVLMRARQVHELCHDDD